MTWLKGKGKGSAFGTGAMHPAGSLADSELAAALAAYRRTVASRYLAVKPDEIKEVLPRGELHVSPKIDGELWYLARDGKDALLVSPNGRAISGNIPLLVEAQKGFASRAGDGTVVAGELFAETGDARSRISDLAVALGGGTDAEVERLRFSAFDVVRGGDEEAPQPGESYAARLATLQRRGQNAAWHVTWGG